MELLCLLGIFFIVFVFIKISEGFSGAANNIRNPQINPEKLLEQAESSLIAQTVSENLNDVTSEMSSKADKIVLKVQEKFGRNLDFSIASIQEVEYFCEQTHQDYLKRVNNNENVTQIFSATINAWGCYVGEVIRRNYEGKWVRLDIKDGSKSHVIQIGNYSLDPYIPIQKRISEGSNYNLWEFFKSTETSLSANYSKENGFRNLQKAFEKLRTVHSLWHIFTEEQIWDWKQNAGASHVINRKPAKIFKKL